jgi:5'-AMP-activated protein kinase catalytic alpha subunit
MEYAEGGELFNHIINKGHLNENEARNIFQQIIDTIDYIHQIGICHRDLKPENILFDSNEKKRIKIIDFGLSNLYGLGDSPNTLETPCGSPGYAPPEMILGVKYKGIMTDIWSSGIILYAMLCGCLPFDDCSEEKLYSKIIKGNFKFPSFLDISKEAKKLINSILVVNPNKRITISEIKKNSWFLKNYTPTLGLFVSISEIPVSNIIVEEMKKLGYEEKQIYKRIKNNNHDSLTTIYYLLVKKKSKEGIETESDLISNKFQEYIRNENSKNSKNNIKPKALKELSQLSKDYLYKRKYTIKRTQELDEMENKTERVLYKIKGKNNLRAIKKQTNRTVSNDKDKNNKISKIMINNIKNIHYININDTQANFLMKTCDRNNSKIKFFKKIVQISKTRMLNSNSKNRNSVKFKKANINKVKNVQFLNYIKFNTTGSKNKTNSKNKNTKKDITRKTNITNAQESTTKCRELKLNMNNIDLRNTSSISIEKKPINKENNVVSKILYNNINNNNKKFVQNKKKIYFNINNIEKSSLLNNSKIKNPNKGYKIEQTGKIHNFMDGITTTRIRQNKFKINVISKSKSKKKKNNTHSNPKTKPKSISLKKNNKNILSSSRNKQKKMYNVKNKGNQLSNVIQERNIYLKGINTKDFNHNKTSILSNKNIKINAKNLLKLRVFNTSENNNKNLNKIKLKNKSKSNKNNKIILERRNKPIEYINNSIEYSQNNNKSIKNVSKKVNKNILIKINDDEKQSTSKYNKIKLLNKNRESKGVKRPYNFHSNNIFNKYKEYISYCKKDSVILDEPCQRIYDNKSNMNISKGIENLRNMNDYSHRIINIKNWNFK